MYPTTALQPGMTGPAVKQLQDYLMSKGLMTQAQVNTGYGIYGPQTTAAVLKLQQSLGMDYSSGPGFFGPKTIAALSSSASGQTGQTGQTTSAATALTTVSPANIINDAAGTSYFSGGDSALITIAGGGYNPQQIWYVDRVNKQLVPFTSMQSAINYYTTLTGAKVTVDQINAALSQIPSSALGRGGGLEGYHPVPITSGFNEQGQLLNPAPSVANIGERYGLGVDKDAEMRAYTALDGFAKLLSDAGVGSTVTSSQIRKIMNDPDTVGFYINALAYGGYSLQDVYRDMVRQQAINTGKASSVLNAYPISSSQTASAYKASANYQAVQSNRNYQVTPTIAGIDASVLSLPVLQLPNDAFRLISPLSDPDSPEFRAEMEKYKSATYQTALKMAQATNESEHANALSEWNTLREQIQSRLGIQLSNNAIQAWNQIESYTAQAGQSNLSGSGIVQQKIDEYLKQQGAANKVLRETSMTDEERNKKLYYLNYASPDERRAFIASNPELAKSWGLIPDDQTKAYMTIENLQKLFPKTPRKDLEAIINKYVDPYGNFYSKLYGNYAAGKYDIAGQQNVAAGTSVMQADLNKTTDALRQYSSPDRPFDKSGTNTLPTPVLPSSTSQTTATKLPAPITQPTPKTTTTTAPAVTATTTSATKTITPTNTQTTTQTVAPTPTPAPTLTQTTGGTYTIKYGDTLGALAKKFGTTVTKLASMNNIADPNKIYAGATLKY